MDLISIIVPVYKVEQYLDRCVESIISQTYLDTEIILVDDGSPDECPVKCDKWAERDKRIKVIHKVNGGLSDARNAGLCKATGDFIGFVDSDDWIAPEMYERLYRAIQEDESDIAACSVQMVWENESTSKMLTKQLNCTMERNTAQLSLLNESELKQPVWYKLYRRETINGIWFEKGKYHEDVFWSYQAVGKANKVSIIDYIGYFYWQHSNSIMGKKYDINRLDGIQAKVQRQEYFKTYFPELQEAGIRNIWFSCIYQGQQVLENMRGNERDTAIVYLKHVLDLYPYNSFCLNNMNVKQKIWLLFSKLAFIQTCKLRNILKIGK